MNKFTFILISAMVASSASAAPVVAKANAGVKSGNPIPYKAAHLKLAPPTGDEEIIYDAPEGKTTYYSRTCYGLREMFGMVQTVLDEGGVVTLVEAEDGTLWMHNSISQFLAPGWVKVDRNENTLTISGPQKVYEEYDWDTDEMLPYFISAVEVERFEDEDGTPMVRYTPTEDGVFSFTVNPETGTIKESGDGSMVLGILSWNEEDGYYWVGYGDQYIVNSLPKDEPVTLPETAIVQKDWAMEYYTTDFYGEESHHARLVDIAIDGDDYYVKGIYQQIPDVWVKGTVADNEVTFPNGQYLGIDMENLKFAYLAAGQVYGDAEEEDQFAMIDEEGLTFAIEKDGTLSGMTNILITPIAGTNTENASFIDYYEAPVIRFQDPATFTNPADPFDLQIENWYPQVSLGCNMPNTDKNGNVLNVDNLYYSIYVNQELYTFEPEVFDYVFEEPTTEIPYLFTDYYNFFIYDTWRAVYVFSTDANPFVFNPGEEDNTLYNLGAQMVYYPEGKDVNPDNVLRSDIILVGEPVPGPGVGVENLFESKSVASEEFIDLQGRAVANPSAGIYLKRVTFTDGTVSTRKVAVK